MLIADLKTPCTKCGGGGYLAGYDKSGSLHTNIHQNCHVCSGNGYLLTEFGEDMWKLYRPMIQELIQVEISKQLKK